MRSVCYEMACDNMVLKDNYGNRLDRSGVCYDSSATVVVQVTDVCPCWYPANAYSNKRWWVGTVGRCTGLLVGGRAAGQRRMMLCSEALCPTSTCGSGAGATARADTAVGVMWHNLAGVPVAGPGCGSLLVQHCCRT